MKGLAGKVAIVTGATHSVGGAIAGRLADEGVAVVGVGRSTDLGERVAAEIRARDGRAAFLTCDVTVEADVARVIDTAVETYGRLDIVVNNAAAIDAIRAGDEHPVADETLDAFDRMMQVGLYAPFNFARLGIPRMLETGGGSFVNISSVASAKGHPGMTGYGPSKAALESLTRQIAVDYGPAGIRANVVMIGIVRTDRNGYLFDTPELSEILLGNQMLDRVGSGADVAAAVAFLASEEAAQVTGAVLPVDGGALVRAHVPDISRAYAGRDAR